MRKELYDELDPIAKQEHRDTINKAAREYRQTHLEARRLCDKKNREKNGEQRRAYEKEWRDKNKTQIKTNYKKWRSTHPNYLVDKRKTNASFKISKNIRCRLESCRRANGFKKAACTQELLGCTWLYAVEYLENNDRGLKVTDKGIHFDHIRPLSSFKNLHCKLEQRTANHYLNLQLLPGKENLRKGADFDYESWAASDTGKQLLELNRVWRMKEYFSEDAVDDDGETEVVSDEDDDSDESTEDSSEDDDEGYGSSD